MQENKWKKENAKEILKKCKILYFGKTSIQSIGVGAEEMKENVVVVRVYLDN